MQGLFLALRPGRGQQTLGVNSLRALELLFAHGEMFTELLEMGHLEEDLRSPRDCSDPLSTQQVKPTLSTQQRNHLTEASGTAWSYSAGSHSGGETGTN